MLAAVIVLRIRLGVPGDVRPATDPEDPGRPSREPSPRAVFLVAWTGMRGVVTLAAVFLLPEDTPKREVLVLMAFVVTVGTLLIQGLTIPTAGAPAQGAGP